MDWFWAYLLLLVIIILAIRFGIKEGATWRSRFQAWLLLFLPVALFMWDYPIVYSQHIQDCRSEGGLKILIKPDRAERIMLRVTDYGGEIEAEGLLKDFYPDLKEVVFINRYGKDAGQYHVSAVNSTTEDRFKRGWTFSITALSSRPKGLYILEKEESFDNKLHRHKQVWSLTKNGNVYAKITNFDHFWPKIRYPDAVLGWSCDPIGDHFPDYYLMKLILN